MHDEITKTIDCKKFKREEVEKVLRSALSEYFQLDMQERVREFDKVKARVVEMESKLQNRLDRQKDIVELQALQILHKADGLDFVIPAAGPTSEYGSSGYSGGPSFGSFPGAGGGASGYPGSGGASGGGISSGSSGGGEGSLAIPGFEFGGYSSGGVEAGGSESASDVDLLLGYDIGFGATKHLRMSDDSIDTSNDPLSTYASTSSASVVDTSSADSKMRTLILAMHQFEQIFHHLPGSSMRQHRDDPPHSWRVAILPLIGQAELYKQYRFNETWDSPHNAQLISKMPQVFSKSKGETSTPFLLIVGDEAAFTMNRPTLFSDITDGTSNTIGLVASALTMVAWTKPEDISSDKAEQNLSQGGWAGMLDGSIRTLRANLSKEIRHALITRGGGEGIDIQDAVNLPGK